QVNALLFPSAGKSSDKVNDASKGSSSNTTPPTQPKSNNTSTLKSWTDTPIGQAINNQKVGWDRNSPLNYRLSWDKEEGDILYIEYYFVFAGNWKAECPDNGMTYGKLFEEGIKQYWHDVIVGMGAVRDMDGKLVGMGDIKIKVDLHITDIDDPKLLQKLNAHEYLWVNFVNDPTHGHIYWHESSSKPLDPNYVDVGIYDYIEKTKKWGAKDFKWIAAHEFGHLLGISGEFYDADKSCFEQPRLVKAKDSKYGYQAYTNPHDIMLNSYYDPFQKPPKVTALDMVIILEALTTGSRVAPGFIVSDSDPRQK
ncbi:MAG: hypothetical protein LBB91_04645, partial [Clostridiales bacterium]|nr:hypothetical protein [Clostridiales bacterium]